MSAAEAVPPTSGRAASAASANLFIAKTLDDWQPAYDGTGRMSVPLGQHAHRNRRLCGLGPAAPLVCQAAVSAGLVSNKKAPDDAGAFEFVGEKTPISTWRRPGRRIDS